MLEITVKTLDSQNHSFSCDDDITVRGFKEHIADTVNVPVESQRLIYCGRVLQNDKKLNDYGNVNGKVIHLVQRAPPQSESRSGSSNSQRQNNNQGWTQGGSRVQYRGHLHRNAMYLGAMSLPSEVVEGHGLPAPQLSNTLSNSRLVSARRMLNSATQLIDRIDDPSVPLHPSPTENSASEPAPQASAPEEEAEQDGNENSNENTARNRMVVQAASEIAAAFSAAALINIRLSHGNGEEGGSVSGSVNLIDASQPEQTAQAQSSETQSERPQTEQRQEQERSVPERAEAGSSESERSVPERAEAGSSESERSESERPEAERNEASTSNNDNQNTSRRSTPQVPRPPQMAELLERLLEAQDRLRPYIECYRTLMSSDPALNPGDGPEGVTENQRIVDGVSESLHYLAHACHALSDIIIDMGQQPPRNLRCRPIIIQQSAILQAGIPIQIESHINLTARNASNNNNATDEGNEATRPSSPTSGTSEQASSRSSSANNRSQNANASLLGTILNLPSNVEVSMELSPQSAMDISSPSATDGTENEQGQTNNNNGNAGATGSGYSMSPPFALIRDALQSVLSERNSQPDSNSGTTTNPLTNIPFITFLGQQPMDNGTSNSGQSTQARSNIGTHPTTSTQTRSTARPHVLHPHTHPLNVGMGMSQSLDFDPFLPCNSHHLRRNTPATANTTSTSQSSQANQTSTTGSHSRSQSASHSASASGGTSVNFTVGGDANITRDLLENDGSAIASGIGLAMTLGELLQAAPGSSDVHISFVGSGPNASEIHLSPNSDVPLAELLRSLNVNLEEFTGRNFLTDLWLFLIRNVSFGSLMQLSVGQPSPFVNLRRPLREFLEHSFPDSPPDTLHQQVVDQIIELSRPYFQSFVVPESEAISRRVDVPATIEAMLRKYSFEFLKLLFNNDLDNSTFAQEAITLYSRLDDQSSAVLQHVLAGGQTSLESIVSRLVNQVTEGMHPFFQQTLLGILSTRIRAYATRTTQMTQEEITSLLIYKDEPSAPPAEQTMPMETTNELPVVEPEVQEQEAQPHSSSSPPQQKSEPATSQPEVKEDAESKEVKSEPMETETSDDKVVDDSMDLANGEDIPETFPGAENLPPEWVPIIARDSVRQRKQAQLQAIQGGPLPFSDAYLSTMPSKRRKLIEQQKPQLLASPTPSSTAITASVERLVREGMSHSQIQEAEGAAHAVASVPAVRRAFGQAIKDSLHPARLKTPDFPNSTRFPNATKYFADGTDKKDKEGNPKPTTTSK